MQNFAFPYTGFNIVYFWYTNTWIGYGQRFGGGKVDVGNGKKKIKNGNRHPLKIATKRDAFMTIIIEGGSIYQEFVYFTLWI